MTATRHSLRNNGAPFADDGTHANDDPKATGGVGRGGCTCGAFSDEALPTVAARRAWHKDHKASAEPATGAAEVPSTELTVEVPYTKSLAFRRSLVREGARGLAEDLGIFVRVGAEAKSIVLAADKAHADRVVEAFAALWDASMEAFKPWKKTNPEYRAARASSMQEGYVLEQVFLRDFVEGVRLAHGGTPKKRASLGVKAGQEAYAESGLGAAIEAATA